jgi:uncharacterized membrane protein
VNGNVRMGKLGEAKTLGGIGSILQFVPAVSILGYILTLIAIKYLSDELSDRSIFDNALYGIIALIAGTVIGLFTFLTGLATAAFTFGIGALAGIFAFLIVLWITLIIASIFIKRSFDTIGTRLGVGSFKTAGMLYLIGSLLVVVFFVGLIVIFVGLIFQIVAFFSINDTPPQTQPMQAAPGPMAQTGMKYCANCGTQMMASVSYCPKCGAKQP